jgi:hypothetical protein
MRSIDVALRLGEITFDLMGWWVDGPLSLVVDKRAFKIMDLAGDSVTSLGAIGARTEILRLVEAVNVAKAKGRGMLLHRVEPPCGIHPVVIAS